ncbi:hypothetical protein K7432_016806 [Basidiobolus ranarum]|uniref:Uncharacterized protein n=1 Tax=Basidiobolus ranarum TaxID=34480 RepID=A0ABR2VMF5_9FUNG
MLMLHQPLISSTNRHATHQCGPTLNVNYERMNSPDTHRSSTGVLRHRRRKNPYPKRSIISPVSAEERLKLGIIKLDAIDNMYRNNPKRLFELGTIHIEHSMKPPSSEYEQLRKHISNTHKLQSDKLKKMLDSTLEEEIVTPPINAQIAAKYKVYWKGVPLDISRHPLYNTLLPEEADVASTLRLKPDQ